MAKMAVLELLPSSKYISPKIRVTPCSVTYCGYFVQLVFHVEINFSNKENDLTEFLHNLVKVKFFLKKLTFFSDFFAVYLTI